LGFFPAYALFGKMAIAIVMLPLVATVWLFGLQSLPAAFIASWLIIAGLFQFVGESPGILVSEFLPGALAGLVVTAIIGWASDTLTTLKLENAKRTNAEEALHRSRQALEARVQVRTIELEQINTALQAEIVERKHAEEEAHRRTAQLEAVRQIGNEITGELELGALLKSIAERALELCGGITSSVYLYDPHRDLLERAVTTHPIDNGSPPIRRRGEGLIGKVWATNAPLVVNDYSAWPQRSPIYEGRPTRAVIGVPVRWGNDFLGVLNVVADPPHQYTPEHVALLSMFADQAAVAIKNARLFDQVRQELAERKHAEDALRASEERYALAALGANDGLWDWDLVTQKMYFSPRWKAMLGYAENEIGVLFSEWSQRVHPDDAAKFQADLEAHLAGRTTHFQNEHRMRCADQTYRWMLSRGIAIRDETGKPLRMAGSMTDITQRKQIEERLLHDALHEPLTGLANRALFYDRVAQMLKSVQRNPHQLAAVFFLDLDRFKIINDSLGHHIGDQLLVQVARRLEACFRATDTIARFGGDEFAILVPDLQHPVDASRAAQRLQMTLSRPFWLDQHELAVTASIGIALTQRDNGETLGYTTPEEILRDADTAMYHAKSLGKARHIIFDASMHAHAVAQLELEADLRRAIDRQEFVVYYQPVFSLTTGAITSAEALLRWQHPTRGLIPPGEFIGIAEDTGLIVPIGEWVLRTACAQIRAWRQRGYSQLRVAVNFSGRQFQRHSLAAQVKQILLDTAVPPQALEIEITERVAMQDADLSARVLQELDEIGIEISIDDFGNSYSALGSLRRFPFRNLKIDRSFLRNIDTDADNAAITTAIIAMARSLKLHVVAEGVETPAQLDFLRAQRCDEAQGYLLSHPLTADQFTALLADQPLIFRADHR
jgi:diguanylate cyclase (GGDEF)-like protein/PAS domain S-box-containing protein